MTLDQIQNAVATEKSPSVLAEYRVLLSHKYAVATDNLEACEMLFMEWWNERRDEYKSDTACERAWGHTENGIQQRHWKLQIRKIDKLMNAISTLIRVKSDEARSII